MIKQISTSLLSPAEINTFVGNILTLVDKTSLEESFVRRSTRLLQSERTVLQDILNKESGNPFTAKLVEKDDERDKAFVFLRDFVRTATQHPNQEMAQRAADIWTYFEKHGVTLYKQGYVDQSSAMGLLFSDLSKPESLAALDKLGASSFYDMLRDAQTAFEEVYKQRLDYESDKVDLPQLRISLQKLGRHISDFISVLHVFIQTEEDSGEKAKLDTLSIQFNEIIDEYMSRAKARKSRKSQESNPS